ncbi:hypothetical protein QZH56_22385 [Streptomyces olivoreticuli]|uniref:DUF7544 domain-containing protein n=1 Tax=Streptomyces olivoreticuli TaxID=68246 RepID=UPI00265A78B4|nr:hypothetical protein [Streptomyces olivoreticuli]WKK21593.1 hypothetical protein QZH56_22385 [Streptomyces olivoreticuli]
MNDTPGRNSPGPSPSDEQPPVVPEEPTPADQAPRTGEDARGSQWAREQPPGGQWSTPSAVPPQTRRTTRERARANSGHQQPGGGGGWGPQAAGGGWGNWTPPVRAPQPGVIPLRPLAVGEIIDGAIRTVRVQWRTALGISLALAVGTQTVATVVTGLWFRDVPDLQSLADSETLTPRELLDAIGSSLGGVGVAWAVGLIGSIIATAMLTVMVSRAILGRTSTIGEAWRSARPQLAGMFGLLVLLPLMICAVFAVGLGIGLLVAAAGAEAAGSALALLGGLGSLVAGAWLWIRYSLAVPALMLEKQGVIASMRRSAKLVRGTWWRVFGVQLLAVALTFVVSMIAQLPVGVVETLVAGGSGTSDSTGWPTLIVSGIGAVISSTLAFPVTAAVTALLYTDQRIRRESLDLELVRAAGSGE